MKVFKTLLVSLLAITAYAQPDDKENLGQFELSVTDRYKAQVMDAQKVLERPNYKDSIQQKIGVEYSIFSSPIEVRMQPEQLSPARIAKIEVPELYSGYIRTGYGMYNTALAEAYYNSGRSAKSSFGFSARHLSSQSGVEDLYFDDNSFSRNHLGTFFNRYYRKFTWHTEATVNLDKYSYYGHPLTGAFANEDSARGAAPFNWYRSYGLRSSIKESNLKSLGWLQKLEVGFNHFDDNYRSSEQDFQLLSDWALPADDKLLYLQLNALYFQNRMDSLYNGFPDSLALEQSTFQFQARPYIHMERNDISFDFGLNLFILDQKDSRPEQSDGRVFFFPELILKWKMIPGVLSLKGGIKGELQRNNFRELSQLSPFIAPGQTTRAGGENRIFAGMEGILASNLSFHLEGGYQIFQNRAFVYADPTFDRALENVLWVGVRYHDVNVLYAKGGLDFNWNEKLIINTSATARSFSAEDPGSRAWYLPYFEANLSASYNLKNKIGFQLSLDYIGSRLATNVAFPNYEALLKPYADLGFKIDYRYNSRIGAFVNLSNLLNSQYDILLGYQAQSIGAMFGLNYRF